MNVSPEVKRRLTEVTVVLVLVALAFSAGRYSAPAEIEQRVEYRTEWKTKTVEVVKWKTARTVDTRTTTTPVVLTVDGGTVVAAATVTEVRERENSSGGSSVAAATDTSSAGKTESRTTALPDWRIGVQVGASLPAPALPITGPLVIGAQVERRILGGVSAGVWGNTVGAGGVAVSVEF